jgi:CBS domain-containing protein
MSTVRSILDEKGRNVVTVASSATLSEAARLLMERRIGAAVVCNAKGALKGILSERDIVRAVARQGGDALGLPVEQVMTSKVKVCTEDHGIDEVMEIMTNGRFRHVPVEQDGKLVGIVSIGDVVKRRIESAVREVEEIKTYIATA